MKFDTPQPDWFSLKKKGGGDVYLTTHQTHYGLFNAKI